MEARLMEDEPAPPRVPEETAIMAQAIGDSIARALRLDPARQSNAFALQAVVVLVENVADVAGQEDGLAEHRLRQVDVGVWRIGELALSQAARGRNRVEVGVKVPVPSDAVCDPIATIVGKKRFLFLDSTELVLPPLARILEPR